MALLFQRDLVSTFKKETLLNASLLRVLNPMPPELSRHLFEEEALEKPNQSFFINFSYYLVCIIDPKYASTITWPLYDTKAERAYRTEFSNFLSKYYKNGLISPVMSSYFVNPGCYKITKLMFQLSTLAIKICLQNNVKSENSKKTITEVTNNYKMDNTNSFHSIIDKTTNAVNKKISKLLHNKEKFKQMADMLKQGIINNTSQQRKAQLFLNKLFDDFLSTHNFSDDVNSQIKMLKNVNSTPPLLDYWLNMIDEDITIMEEQWQKNTSSLIETSRTCHDLTQELILRHTGQIDKSLYTVEFDPDKDDLRVENLENHVPSQQRCILKNMVKNGKLSFPNLIRGYVVALCYIYKNVKISEDIYQLNRLLESGQDKYKVVLSAFRDTVTQMESIENKFELTPVQFYNPSRHRDILFSIPALPNLTFAEETSKPVIFDTYTPLKVSRRQFNLKKKHSMPTLTIPKLKSFAAPFVQVQDEFMKTIVGCQFNSYSRIDAKRNTSISNRTLKVNETVAGCSTGFTKDQINRLLSTKKSSSKKKSVKVNTKQDVNMRRGLFTDPANSSSLFRSYSSPELYSNSHRMVEIKSARKLDVMHENNTDILELSGIVALETSKINAPYQLDLDYTCQVLKQDETLTPDVKSDDNSLKPPVEPSMVTPKLEEHTVRKTSSIEKIINRFKKVRAKEPRNQEPNRTEPKNQGEDKETNAITEEKENVNVANKILLPDLLEQSCVVGLESPEWGRLDFKTPEERRKTRESLGTALGVDNTFLDKFELID